MSSADAASIRQTSRRRLPTVRHCKKKNDIKARAVDEDPNSYSQIREGNNKRKNARKLVPVPVLVVLGILFKNLK